MKKARRVTGNDVTQAGGLIALIDKLVDHILPNMEDWERTGLLCVLDGLLQWDPHERMSAAKALETHPAVQKAEAPHEHDGPDAAADPPSTSRSLALALWQNLFAWRA